MCVCTGRKKHLNLTEMMFSYAHWQIKMTTKLPKMAVSGKTNKQTNKIQVLNLRPKHYNLCLIDKPISKQTNKQTLSSESLHKAL